MAARVFASPNARRLAREAGLRIGDLTGTGPDGRIIGRDVRATLERRGPKPRSVPGGVSGWKPRSPGQPPPGQVTVRATVRVRRLLKLCDRLNAEDEPVQVTLDALVVKAAARTQRLVRDALAPPLTFPVNMAVAVPDVHGVLPAVLKDADTMPVSAVAAVLRDLGKSVEDGGGLPPADFECVMLSVIDLGRFGIEEFDPVGPRAGAVLGVGAVHEEPVAEKGRVKAAPVMRVSLVAEPGGYGDPVAAKWMRTFVGIMHNPVRILL